LKDRRDGAGGAKKNTVPVNEQIHAQQVQMIDENGVNQGVLTKSEALRLAREAGLDLVLIAEQGGQEVPVVKIMDFGKALYEKKKKQAESKKRQTVIEVKEVKLRPKIGEHDFITKMNQGIGFLKSGKHLKITLVFRGREVANKRERGQEMFDKIHQIFEAQGLLKDLMQEEDAKAGQFWSRIYYLK
jgi:translation initiation factor IF-3